MSSQTSDLVPGVTPCQAGRTYPCGEICDPVCMTEPPQIRADLRRLDRAAGLVFAVLIALAALVVLDSIPDGSGDELVPSVEARAAF